MSGEKDGQTLFHTILPAIARRLTSTTVAVRNKKCDVALIKHYCITGSMQKISSIHKLIQQILGSHELNDDGHFWPRPPKNHWNSFLLSWICTTMQKISSFHQFILEIQPILESCDQTGHIHSAHAHPKSFWSTFNLCELVSTWKKLGYFIDLFWRYSWLKILQSDWLRTFWPISQEPEFSQMWDLCRNTANNINFHYRKHSVKINDKMFQHIQKNPVFGPFLTHFPNFWSKKRFFEKSGSVMHKFIWVSSIMPKFRKN